eukprot:4331435-Pleurochrysis_carterae.AAC.1
MPFTSRGAQQGAWRCGEVGVACRLGLAVLRGVVWFFASCVRVAASPRAPASPSPWARRGGCWSRACAARQNGGGLRVTLRMSRMCCEEG